MDTERLGRYARLIAVTGGGIRPGQSVVIRAGLDQPEFTLALAEECYRAGAAEVEVEWEYQPLAKLDNKYMDAGAWAPSSPGSSRACAAARTACPSCSISRAPTPTASPG